MLKLSEDTLFDSEKRRKFKEIYKKLNLNVGKYVKIGGEAVNLEKRDTIYPYTKNITILINEYNACITEQFLLAAKQSR